MSERTSEWLSTPRVYFIVILPKVHWRHHRHRRCRRRGRRLVVVVAVVFMVVVVVVVVVVYLSRSHICFVWNKLVFMM